jgi:hypothetical protein
MKIAALSLGFCTLLSSVSASEYAGAEQEPLRAPIDPVKYKAACPDYKSYSMRQQYVTELVHSWPAT